MRSFPLIVVCTHHKTGTVWMGEIFRALRRRFERRLFEGPQSALPADADIFLQDHSRVDLDALRHWGRPVRGVHVIRDPRDVVISGCFYHQKTSEKWANTPKARFGGRSYRETINALADDHARLLFEMEHTAADTITDMLAWNYRDPDVFETRYEALIEDSGFEVFGPMMRFLGFEGEALEAALGLVRDHSLFGGARADGAHVRSGARGQWAKVFTPELKARFLARHPNALQQLGYETDTGWSVGSPGGR